MNRSSTGAVLRLICSVCMILFWGPIPVSAADAGFSSLIESVMSLDFPKIRVMMRVYTPDATELSFDAFKLSERQSLISTFTVELVRKEPYVALLLDRSSSMEPVVGTVKESAAAFVKGMSGPARVSLITFASDVDLVTGFIREQEQLLAGIGKMRPWGGTALFDALYQACEQLRSAAQIDDRKTIVLLTDGRDESPQGKPGFSTHEADEVIEHARKNNIRVICVALGTNIDETFLKRIAGETKGALLRAPSADKLAGIFQAISARMMLERRYKISYTTPSPERDGTRRELTVASELKGRKDQGTGSYVAPVDPVKAEAPTAPAGKRETGGRGIGIRDGGPSSPDIRMGSKTIRHDVKLGRVEAPDTGTSEEIAHVERQRLATWTDLATDAMPAWEEYKPIEVSPGASEQEKAHIAEMNATLKASHDAHQQWRRDFTNQRNQDTERLNSDMRQMHDDQQKSHDQFIDGVNANIDSLNESKREMHESHQRQAEENAAQTNQTLENLEKSLSTEFQVPAAQDWMDQEPTEEPETTETPDTDDDD